MCIVPAVSVGPAVYFSYLGRAPRWPIWAGDDVSVAEAAGPRGGGCLGLTPLPSPDPLYTLNSWPSVNGEVARLKSWLYIYNVNTLA